VRRALSAALLCALLGAPLAARGAQLNVIRIDGMITAGTADFIERAIAQSENQGAEALLIELDTPGGALDATKDIVQALLNAPLPVIVYVAPQGAWAASAGTFITLAATVAAMAPGTSIGAASPVSIGPGSEPNERDEKGERTDVLGQKIEKFTSAFIRSIAEERHRNVEWAAQAVQKAEAIGATKALELGVVDVVARDRQELLEKLDGREVEVGDGVRKLALAGVAVQQIQMTTLERLFAFIANPNVAVLLVMGAVLGILLEFNSPGVLLPGAIGLACLVLAVFAFDLLPFSALGLVLMLVGVGLMVAEIFITSYGLLFVGGIALFLLGGMMLFDVPEAPGVSVSFWGLLVPAVAGVALVMAVVVFGLAGSVRRAQISGVGELVGLVGRTETTLAPEGRVFVRGEYWTAHADEEIPPGRPVEVVAVEGMRLRVRPAASQA
jgi:membrane-bound serine protease (ClpP class)